MGFQSKTMFYVVCDRCGSRITGPHQDIVEAFQYFRAMGGKKINKDYWICTTCAYQETSRRNQPCPAPSTEPAGREEMTS